MSLPTPTLSIVVPVYGCGSTLAQLHGRIDGAISAVQPDYELLLVDDASPDDAWSTIVELAERHPKIRGVKLSRNFGQHRAITAGLDRVQGQWIVVMDCDLQDQPEEIPKLWRKAMEGFDVVSARRTERQDSLRDKLSSRAFYWVFDALSGTTSDSAIANFGIYSRRAIEAIKSRPEQSTFFPLAVDWIGFPRTTLEIEHSEREEGDSSYSWLHKASLGIDALIGNSNRPLHLSIRLGMLMAVLSFLVGIAFTVQKLAFGVSVEGWTALMVTMVFLFGLLFINLGVVGIYLGKVFDESKQRPLYLVEADTNQPPPHVEAGDMNTLTPLETSGLAEGT